MRNTIESAKTEVSNLGWELLTNEYKNLETEMEFRCPEGHKVYTSLKKFRTKQECPVCKQNPYKDVKEGYRKKDKNITRVLALDQATGISGFSIFDGNTLVKYGTFKTKSNDEAERIEEIKNWVSSLITNWKPDRIQIEDIQLQRRADQKEDADTVYNVNTYKVLAHLQGVLINLCLERGVICETTHVSIWRQYCGIKGKARADKKRNAQLKVKEWYDISVSNDEADAICIGRYASNVAVKNSTLIEWG